MGSAPENEREFGWINETINDISCNLGLADRPAPRLENPRVWIFGRVLLQALAQPYVFSSPYGTLGASPSQARHGEDPHGAHITCPQCNVSVHGVFIVGIPPMICRYSFSVKARQVSVVKFPCAADTRIAFARVTTSGASTMATMSYLPVVM